MRGERSRREEERGGAGTTLNKEMRVAERGFHRDVKAREMSSHTKKQAKILAIPNVGSIRGN
jgi:hypothetical protein